MRWINYQQMVCANCCTLYHPRSKVGRVSREKSMNYRTRVILTRGLYIFYPIFTAVYIVERLVTQGRRNRPDRPDQSLASIFQVHKVEVT